MTEKEIWFNYEQAMAQANALEEIARRLESMSSHELDGGLHDAASNWTGDNARRFQSKGRRLQEQVDGTARNLRNAAEEVRSIARKNREIELANLALIMEDSSGG